MKTALSMKDLRHLAVVFVDYLGPMTVEQLASQLYVWREVAANLLDNPVFSEYPRPWGGPRLYTLRNKLISKG